LIVYDLAAYDLAVKRTLDELQAQAAVIGEAVSLVQSLKRVAKAGASRRELERRTPGPGGGGDGQYYP